MKKGFTLIELLIVVAIIGILAAVAVPNFLNAQIRAKVSQCVSNMRSVGQALEMYLMDKGTYPRWAWDSRTNPDDHYSGFRDLTTPVVYIQHEALANPFLTDYQKKQTDILQEQELDPYFEMGTYKMTPYIEYPNFFYRTRFPKNIWLLESAGPDTGDDYDTKIYPLLTLFYHSKDGPVYQPSNGIISKGDIFRGGGVYVADWVQDQY